MKQKIVVDPKILGGKPVISGTRIPVYMILELLATGASEKKILKDYYPQITKDAILAAVKYAAKTVAGEEIHFLDTKRDKIHIASLE
ncbi:MAG: DUF433 domain-containing protein [Patescibacteria group bacterium]